MPFDRTRGGALRAPRIDPTGLPGTIANGLRRRCHRCAGGADPRPGRRARHDDLCWGQPHPPGRLLAKREGISLAERGLRRILAEANVRPVRTRRPRYRSRGERMPREGQLLRVDGSRHRWFGPDFPFATLVAGIDDATGGCPAVSSAPRRMRSATSRRSPRRPIAPACRERSTPIATGSSSSSTTGRRPSPSSSPASAA